MKSGDDCRQEHLAVQLISHFYGRQFFLSSYVLLLEFFLSPTN